MFQPRLKLGNQLERPWGPDLLELQLDAGAAPIVRQIRAVMKGVAKAVDELLGAGEARSAGSSRGSELVIGFREPPTGPVHKYGAKEIGVRANRQNAIHLSRLPFDLQHLVEHLGLEKRA